MTRKDTFGIDVPRVTRDEAVELMVHHLGLAASYFEATPEDAGAQVSDEIRRALDGPAVAASLAFATVIHSEFEEMKERDE